MIVLNPSISGQLTNYRINKLMGIFSYIEDTHFKLFKTANLHACKYKKVGRAKHAHTR